MRKPCANNSRTSRTAAHSLRTQRGPAVPRPLIAVKSSCRGNWLPFPRARRCPSPPKSQRQDGAAKKVTVILGPSPREGLGDWGGIGGSVCVRVRGLRGRGRRGNGGGRRSGVHQLV